MSLFNKVPVVPVVVLLLPIQRPPLLVVLLPIQRPPLLVVLLPIQRQPLLVVLLPTQLLQVQQALVLPGQERAAITRLMVVPLPLVLLHRKPSTPITLVPPVLLGVLVLLATVMLVLLEVLVLLVPLEVLVLLVPLVRLVLLEVPLVLLVPPFKMARLLVSMVPLLRPMNEADSPKVVLVLPELLFLGLKNVERRLCATFVGALLVGFGPKKKNSYTLIMCHSWGICCLVL